MRLDQNNEELFANLGYGDIAIDCGANLGHVTYKMAEKGATVFAFEPNPYVFALLQERFRLQPNVVCINKGVWHRNDKMKLYMYADSKHNPVGYSYASSIFANNPIIDQQDYVEVDIVDLTEFIHLLGRRIKLLKIDIEGAEFDILEKLIATNQYWSIDRIVVETHEWLIPDTQERAARLRQQIADNHIHNIDLNWN